MKSVRNIYKKGIGPSSSHTMGPAFAAADFIEKYPDADSVKAVLFGSLAKTGKGHGTDRAISGALSPIPAEIVFNMDDTVELSHPNTMELTAFKEGKKGSLGINHFDEASVSAAAADCLHLGLALLGEGTVTYGQHFVQDQNVRIDQTGHREGQTAFHA